MISRITRSAKFLITDAIPLACMFVYFTLVKGLWQKRRLEIPFVEIDPWNKIYGVQEILRLHKLTRQPRGYVWLDEEDVYRAISEGYDPDRDFIFTIDDEGIPNATLRFKRRQIQSKQSVVPVQGK